MAFVQLKTVRAWERGYNTATLLVLQPYNVGLEGDHIGALDVPVDPN